MILTDDDLHNKKYDELLLEKNINNLSLWSILLFQKVSANFCVKYFWSLDDKYAKDEDDCEIYLSDILHWQPHLTKEMIHNCDEYKSRLD
jgi:hypothetical protein